MTSSRTIVINSQYQNIKFYDNGVIDMEKDNLKEVEGNYLMFEKHSPKKILTGSNKLSLQYGITERL